MQMYTGTRLTWAIHRRLSPHFFIRAEVGDCIQVKNMKKDSIQGRGHTLVFILLRYTHSQYYLHLYKLKRLTRKTPRC